MTLGDLGNGKPLDDSDGLVYLASPYSHADPAVREQRFRAVCRAAAELMRAGTKVFCPISHTHPLACIGNLPKGWEFWKQYDIAMLRACDRMIILRLPGWEQSEGIKGEIAVMEELGKPITHIYPKTEPTIVYVMGTTCSGKTTFFDSLVKRNQGSTVKIALVQVGKILRAKYPPEHFQGSGSPKHTEAEALEIYRSETAGWFDKGADYVFVDGQPRNINQVGFVLDAFPAAHRVFVLLTCNIEEQYSRIARRFAVDQVAAYGLAMARTKNDRIDGYDTLANLLGRGETVHAVDTTELTPEEVFQKVSGIVGL